MSRFFGRPWRRAAVVSVAAVLSTSAFVPPAGAAPADRRADQHAQRSKQVKLGKAAIPSYAKPAVPDAKPAAPAWPQGSGEVALARAAGAKARIGAAGLGLSAVGAGATAPTRVKAETLSRDRARAVGRDLVVKVSRADGGTASGPVAVSLDVSAFKGAYGGGWADRLRLAALPDCALTTPAAAGCSAQALPTTRSGDTLTATVAVGATASLVTLAADGGGGTGGGDFAATALTPSGTWSAGGSSGNFTWQYPLDLPPSLNGPAPTINLGYSSQSSDGKMAVTNNQPSWLGEGFEWSPGYIERRYVNCADDMGSGANNTTKTGDLCWKTDNATVSINGTATELLYNSSDGAWHGRTEDGSLVQRFTGASNGDDDGEYWVVTSQQGVKYYFGLNRLQGWTSGKPETKSVQTVNVFGNNAGEPCHQDTFKASDCDGAMQAYRWNLDYVVDPHGNTMSLWWDRDTNKYGRNMSETDLKEYTRDAWLDHVDYGTHQRDKVGSTPTDTVFTGKASPMRVEFGTGLRCLSSCGTEDSPTTANWLDTPFDLRCTKSPCDDHSPTFWSTKRLATVTTKVWDAASGGYRPVDRWTLTHSWPDPGDFTKAGMWLKSISRSGLVGGTATLPDIAFRPIMLDNRVDTALYNGLRPMRRPRIDRITTESGGIIDVDYAPTECSRGNLPAAASNTKRCYPVRWEPEDGNEIVDWFHKQVVQEVRETDATGPTAGSPLTKTTHYEYVGDAAWHYADDDGLTKDKFRTWNQWRGYETVRTLVGVAAEQTRSETRYFRGMDGDRASASGGTKNVQLSDSKGFVTVDDADEFAGQVLETKQYDSPTGSVYSGTVSRPWRSAATATRTIDNQTVSARFVAEAESWEWGRLDGGRGDRVTHVARTYDGEGRKTEQSDDGDTAKTGDEQCELTDYRANTAPSVYLLTTVSRIRTYALTCAVAKQAGRQIAKSEIIGEVRTSYDGHAWNATPARGEVTQVDQLADWVNNAFVGMTSKRATYDDYGRVTDAWDIDGLHTGTAYTPAADGPVTAITTTPPRGSAWATTQTLEPAFGEVTSDVDANGRRTDRAYDPLGRLSDVWKPGRPKSTYPTAPSISYRYTISNTAASVVTTSTLAPNGNYLVNYTFYDALMRKRQTQGPTGDGSAGAVVTDLFYDSAGRQWRTFGPYIPDSSITTAPSAKLSPPPANSYESVTSWVMREYDGAGRTVKESTFFGLSRLADTRTAYPSADRIETTPPNGGYAVSKVYDTNDRVVELRQHRGATPASAYDTTRYEYSPTGKLTKIKNAGGTEWVHEFDVRGREVRTVDPDKGEVRSTYDNAGRLLTSTDARGTVLRYAYDDLGRTEKLYDATTATPVLLAKYGYDGLTGAKGMRTSATRYVGGETGAAYTASITAVSAFGTPSQEKYSIPAAETGLAGDYVYDTTFKPDGSTSTLRMPLIGKTTGLYLGFETLTTTYNDRGQVDKLSTTQAGASYVVGTSYTDLGELGTITLRNNNGPIVQIGHYYDESTRRLSRIWTTRDTAPTTVADTNYTYDANGTLTRSDEKSSVTGAETQCFEHDYLQRLVTAWTPASHDCAGAPSSALDGPAPYWRSWEFDASGNRTKQVDHTGGATTGYTYPAATAAHPHALMTTTDASGATTGRYRYDANGNTTCRPTSQAVNDCDTGSGSQQLAWDPEGHLASATSSAGVSSYIYSADGARLIAKDPGGKTLTLPGQELRVNAGGSTVLSATRVYTWAGVTIAMRSAGATGLCWINGDRQGSVNTVIGTTGSQAVTVRRQDPYGNVRGSVSGTWPSTLNRGFVGGITDSTGLVHLGAREYDPMTGRFVSLDPVIDTSDPQQMEGYSYADGSPILKSDPLGTRPDNDRDMAEDRKVAREKRDQHFRDQQDHTSRHNRARDIAVAIITAMVILRKGDPSKIRVEIHVPGASKNKTGNAGRIDILYEDDEAGIVWVWEVKKSTYASSVATAEIESYRPYLQKVYRGMQIRPGFALAVPPVGVVYPSPHPNELIRVTNGTTPGAIMYDVVEDTKADWRRVPYPIPYPVYEPGKAGNKGTAKQPNPQPGACGGGLTCPNVQPGMASDTGGAATASAGGVMAAGVVTGIGLAGLLIVCTAATGGACALAVGGGLLAGSAATAAG